RCRALGYRRRERLLAARRESYLAPPRLIGAPARLLQVMRDGRDDVGADLPEIDVTVAVVIDGDLEHVRRCELRNAERAGPRAFHLAGRRPTLVDDLERGQELRAKLRGAPSVERQRRDDVEQRLVDRIGTV